MKEIIRSCKMRDRSNAGIVIAICILWSAGLLVGRCVIGEDDGVAVAILRASALLKPNLPLQICGQLFPLLLTSVSASFFGARAVYPVAFLDAVFIGLAARLSLQAFGSAGWLVYRILYFSDSTGVLVLLWIWFRTAKDRNYLSSRRLLMFSSVLIVIALFDYFVCADILVSVRI